MADFLNGDPISTNHHPLHPTVSTRSAIPYPVAPGATLFNGTEVQRSTTLS